MFDSHKAGKNIRFINALWALQLVQLVLVLIAPAVFASAIYIGALDCANRLPFAFGWATWPVFWKFGGAEIWVTIFLTIYSIWSFRSFYAFKGRMPEIVCQSLAIVGFVFMFPVYYAVWSEIFTKGVNVVDGLVICSLLLPIVIALAQSATSAALYIGYLPWFLFLILFFLVFTPSYSFARLWDTTWGNRATGKDSAISETVERTMKSRNLMFVFVLVSTNIALTYAFVNLFSFGYNYVLAFMFIVFLPMIVQLICSFLFLFIVIPLRNLTSRSFGSEEVIRRSNISVSDTRSNRSGTSGSHSLGGGVGIAGNDHGSLDDIPAIGSPSSSSNSSNQNLSDNPDNLESGRHSNNKNNDKHNNNINRSSLSPQVSPHNRKKSSPGRDSSTQEKIVTFQNDSL
jgi:uncharacterized membrane protein YgcG